MLFFDLARQYRPTSANSLSLGTYYCITFTPPFVSKDFNKLNTPASSFEGALDIEIVVRLFCLPLSDFLNTFCILFVLV